MGCHRAPSKRGVLDPAGKSWYPWGMPEEKPASWPLQVAVSADLTESATAVTKVAAAKAGELADITLASVVAPIGRIVQNVLSIVENGVGVWVDNV